jgi:hypothetical protein
MKAPTTACWESVSKTVPPIGEIHLPFRQVTHRSFGVQLFQPTDQSGVLLRLKVPIRRAPNRGRALLEAAEVCGAKPLHFRP